MIEAIGFDADDTLWHSEIHYARAQREFGELLSPYVSSARARQQLQSTEAQNLPLYGYGIKGFALSMVEAAVGISERRISASVIGQILGLARAMLQAPVQLLDGVKDVLAELAPEYELLLITKGDLFDQKRKIAASGLEPYFRHIEVVHEKTVEVYREILDRHQIAPARFLMVGNSLRSDILPLVSLGAQAVRIPYHVTWEHEQVSPGTVQADAYIELEHLKMLPGLVRQLSGRGRDER